ncbi:hypothetical protein FT643_12295 [Ketobacter sp. MCCC 1A13808]|uniref:helix-hairpin-helix domain-containing protein n=1 Tax=Ketobacter sp. MCCC 1A13808 TaxID=2602738 RepID=UPI0012EB5CB0|nr:helix-hairpin-helix domain-containing protein [Ketobacter sp. MCCC 1A13808]MVF12922.1 hypothetical protein [Ketobacter sp. MCCC 1A13808]
MINECQRRSFRFICLFSVLLVTLKCIQPDVSYAREEFLILLPININEANALTLSRALTGIGPKKAEAIIAFREEHGDFENLHDLLQVRGIGPGTLAKNHSRITLE